MGCFVHGYIGPGVSIRNLLRTAESLGRRSRLGHGIVVWPDINEDPVRIRRATTWDRFFDVEEDGTAVGYAVEQFEAKGFSVEDRVQMGMVHGRYATSGDLRKFPDTDCHPFCKNHQGKSIYYVHNGHLETHMMEYSRLTALNFSPEAEIDSATCGALLAHDILVSDIDCMSASSNLVSTLEATGSTGALLFARNSEPERMYAIRVEMPLVIIRSEWGCFLSSDVSVLRAMPDQEVEVYCLRNGATGWVDTNQQIQLVDSKGLHSSGHYGKMFLRKEKINRLEGMQSCLKTIETGHQIEMWDKRTLTKWSLWNTEHRCLSCACERRENAERDSNPDFEMNNSCPIDL